MGVNGKSIERDTTLFVDFDHTLYNSRRFLRAFFSEVVLPHGVTWQLFIKSFDALTEGENERPYTPLVHLQNLAHLMGLPDIFAKRVEDFLLNRSGLYMYRDSRKFLAWANGQLGLRVELLTFAHGPTRFAQLKSCDIADYFHKLNIFSASRQEKVDYVLQRSANAGKYIILDDHPYILKQTIGTNLRAIRIRRRIVRKYLNTEPPLPGVLVVRTLAGARQAVELLINSKDAPDDQTV